MGDDQKKEDNQEKQENLEVQQNENNRLTSGSYYLHIFIEETSAIVNQDPESTMTLKLKVTAFDKSRYSVVHKDVTQNSTITYNEHFHFQKDFDNKEAIQKEIISVEAFDTGVFNTQVGSIQIQVPSIYYAKNHVLHHQWYILNNPDVDPTKPSGFVQLSINLVKGKEKQQTLKPETPEEKMKGDAALKLMISPQFKIKKRIIKISVLFMHRLVGMDSSFFSSETNSDPYIKAKIGADKAKTRVIKNVKTGSAPTPIYQNLFLSYIDPSFLSDITLSLMDHDSLSKNDHFGTMRISLADIQAGVYNQPTWSYFYGGHSDISVDNEEVKKTMNLYPDAASQFKGAVLFKIEDAEGIEHREACEPMQKQIPLPTEEKFIVMARVYSVQNLVYRERDTVSNHKVMIEWGGKSVKTQKVPLNQGVLSYYEYVQLEENFAIGNINGFYQSKTVRENILGQLPDICVYLENSDTKRKVSFLRFKPTDLYKEKGYKGELLKGAFYQYFDLDDSFENLEIYGSGLLHIQLQIMPYKEFNQNGAPFNNSNSLRHSFKKVFMNVDVYQAKELPASDENSLSDPVVLFFHYGSVSVTPAIKCTLNPIWMDRLFLPTHFIEFDGQTIKPPLIANVFDKDPLTLGGNTYEFLGQCAISTQDEKAQRGPYTVESDQNWNNLRYSINEQYGKILLSVNYNMDRPVRSQVPLLLSHYKLNDYMLKIQIIGMRDLKSSGNFSVRQPALIFDTSSLYNVNSGGDFFSKLTCDCKKGGPNPTIGQCINIEAKMLEKDFLKPSINVTVIDKSILSFGGTRMIGTFQIDLEATSFYYKYEVLIMLSRLKKIVVDDLHQAGGGRINRSDAIPGIDVMSKKVADELIEQIRLVSDPKIIKMKYPQLFLDIKELENPNSSSKFSIKSNDHVWRVRTAARGVTSKVVDFALHSGKNKANHTLINPMDADGFGEYADDEEEEEEEGTKQAGAVADKISIMLNMDKGKAGITTDNKTTLENIPVVILCEETIMEPQNNSANQTGGDIQLVEVVKKNQPEALYSQFYYKVGLNLPRRKKKDSHYRIMLDCPLEERTEFFGGKGMPQISIRRGKSINNKEVGYFESFFEGEESFKEVGAFKGNVILMDKKLLQDLQNLNLASQIRSLGFPATIQDWQNSSLESDFLKPVKCTIVVYVLSADIYDKYDVFSENDTYLKIKVGNFEINDRENTIQDRDNPIFNFRYEIDHEFPGASTLNITLMEQDDFFDDYIGEVKVDLEERFYNEKYRRLQEVPIETHHVINKDSDLTVGKLKFWVDIFRNENKKQSNKRASKRSSQRNAEEADSLINKNDSLGNLDSLALSQSEIQAGDAGDPNVQRNFKLWDISSIPPQTMQLRVIIWETNDVPNNDPEDMSDIFVQGILRGDRSDTVKTTDTHWRSCNGFGSFNWRLVFDLHIDQYSLSPEFQDKLKLELQIWDQDLLSSNDFLSSVEVDLRPLIDGVVSKQVRMFLRDGKAYTGGKKKEHYLTTLPNQSGAEWNSTKSNMKVTIELVTAEEVKKTPVGEGRSDPNQDPFLPQPVGRFQWSWNPFELFKRLVGPQARSKVCIFGCLLCYFIICILIFPVVIGMWVSKIVSFEWLFQF